LRFVGSLEQSAEAQAAYAIACTGRFSLITWTSGGLLGATAALAGQTPGAGRPGRVPDAGHAAVGIGPGAAVGPGAAAGAVPPVLLGVFGTHDPGVVEIGVGLLRFLSVSGLFVTVALIYTGGLQGTGDTRSPFYISVVSQVVVPLGLCWLLQATRGLEPAGIWTAILLGHMTRCSLSVFRFRQGKWRGIEVDIPTAQRAR